MGRLLLLLLVGAIVGAALFHAYYLKLEPAARCHWDHPLDRQAREACTAASTSSAAYSTKARHELDDLVSNVTR